MFIQTFPSGPFSTNSYLVACEKSKEAAIIDAPPDSFLEIFDFLTMKQFKATKLLLTHSHWDHIADVRQWKDNAHLSVYLHPLDLPNLERPGSDGLPCWLTILPANADALFEEGGQVSVGEFTFQVIHTPGHSPGSICLFEPRQRVLFSGDTLFKETIGNLSFPTSQPSLMWPSLEKLSKLPPETKVYPGHGPMTTIQAEPWLSNAKNLFSL